jgi:hypothetical protein
VSPLRRKEEKATALFCVSPADAPSLQDTEVRQHQQTTPHGVVFPPPSFFLTRPRLGYPAPVGYNPYAPTVVAGNSAQALAMDAADGVIDGRSFGANVAASAYGAPAYGAPVYGAAPYGAPVVYGGGAEGGG